MNTFWEEMKTFKIGTSGFSFSDWRSTIYPATISPRDMLSYYVSELGFDTVEINSSYYRIPEPKNMRAQFEKTPKSFEFVIKGFRGMTHDPFDNRLESRFFQ